MHVEEEDCLSRRRRSDEHKGMANELSRRISEKMQESERKNQHTFGGYTIELCIVRKTKNALFIDQCRLKCLIFNKTLSKVI